MRLFITLLTIALFATPFVFTNTQLPQVSETRSEVTHIPETEMPSTEKETPVESSPQKPAVEKPKPAPTPAPIPTPVPAKTSDTAALLEEKIFAFTNSERTRRNLGALTADATLAATARAHSADMLARNFFEHDNPDGCSSSCRATNAGYAWRMIGENLYMLDGFEFSPEETAAMIVSGWMESAGHRANILKEGYTETGVGVVVQGRAIYATVLYATPR